jgi:hypothetical protein
MKNILLLISGFIFSLTIIAQGNSGNKGKEKAKSKKEKSVKTGNNQQSEQEVKEKKEKDDHIKKVWDGTTGKRGNGPKASKNQPAKVRAAFQRDYPNAGNVTWSKYRGDWTATFKSGLNMSTALYHANGERRDTRTSITKNEVPRNVLDSIFKRRPGTWLEDIIKIDLSNDVKNIFRFKETTLGKTEYFYYNSDGQLVKYDY